MDISQQEAWQVPRYRPTTGTTARAEHRPRSTGQETKGMRTALGQLLSDFLSAIVFLAIYGSTDNLYLATGAAIAVSLAQFAAFKMRGQPVDAMQWLVLGMVVVLGSATLITGDSRFVIVEPSIGPFAVGPVMLRRGWPVRHFPPSVP